MCGRCSLAGRHAPHLHELPYLRRSSGASKLVAAVCHLPGAVVSDIRLGTHLILSTLMIAKHHCVLIKGTPCSDEWHGVKLSLDVDGTFVTVVGRVPHQASVGVAGVKVGRYS